ncbi:MAG TPA: phenylacetate-CoA oxygenase subunit PaaC [Terricaulis sp.]|nr:phenylacetate-CoA oxygenase subunit PaaC [Terricaulis sp.]
MDALAIYALRLGDDALILGQRLSEWCGHAPALEVDLSLANMALDQVGQATHFLGLAGVLEGKGRDADALAFHRDVMDFTNCLLVEQPNGDFAQTIARQFLYAHYQHLLFERMATVNDERFAAIAAKAVKETAYHAQLASDWVIRLGDGTDESRARMIAGLDWMWRFVDEMFAMDDIDEAALKAGAGIDKTALRAAWDERVNAALAEATLERPASRRPVLGGRAGRHSEHLGHLLTHMQFLQRAYPGATW